ncbi:cation-translocating P-type ATPase [Candidatus Woesearchaeota archaeon]|nr:cation-translocating P-type ATPase [Candidatus Woesearchaeota archaeon]
MFYDTGVAEIYGILETRESGLSQEEVKVRLEKHGYNEFKKEKRITWLKILIAQFNDPLIYILIAAILISTVLNEFVDSLVIAAILIINAAIGFFQEYKAEKAIELLKKLAGLKSKVIREGNEIIIDSKEIVPGDILILESGDKISADARIIECYELKTDESSLTGESTPVKKSIEVINREVAVADQINMVFSGTSVVYGRGKAIVTSTGMSTEVGKIAKLVQEIIETKTPIQEKMVKFGKSLGLGAILVCVVVFLIGYAKGLNFIEMLLTALSLAVAIVPEGLPVVVTICLAIGVRRMLKVNSLIRRLKAIETLGSVQVICADKTGTITKNEMTVTRLFVNNRLIDVTGKGYETKGEFLLDRRITDPKNFKILLEIMSGCNNASIELGDPTERALIVLGKKAGVEKRDRIDEVPFDSAKKWMSTTHIINGKRIIFIKGAPEVVVGMCNNIHAGKTTRRFTPNDKQIILDNNKVMASDALRVLAAAYQIEKKIVFVGLVGMIDPPREEVKEAVEFKEAVELCKKAGIRTIMITGDHKLTAEAVGKEVGIKGIAIEGIQLDKIDDEKLKEVVKEHDIYARVNPEHKVRILNALQELNYVVAMTGDGVNDAPALKKADVGVAMGIQGTDVARESSDMVLLDDNFASVVKAVKEGRVIYDNLRKFIMYLLSANFGELLIILVSMILFKKELLPLLLPLQLLWINLVTDSLPALALGVDPEDGDVMSRKPRKKEEGILKGSIGFIVISGIISMLAVLTLFEWYSVGHDVDKTRTLALTTLVFFELFLVFSCRSNKSVFEFNVLSNRYVIFAVLASGLLQVLLVMSPVGMYFGLTPLGMLDWIGALMVSGLGVLLIEGKKFYNSRNIKTDR